MMESPGSILLVAIGGGGDIASTAMLARFLSRTGTRTRLASVAWERYIYDPVPGPIRLDEIYNYISKNNYYLVASSNTYAIRGGRRIDFQAVKASEVLGEEIYIIDIYNGVEGYVKALEEITSREGIESIIGLDVGGDSLASGCEDELWSPLADWIGLAALARVRGILGVHSPGSDGELSQEYVIKRIDEFSVKGGLLGVRIMSREDATILEELLEHVDSEASKMSLLAYNGLRGSIEIRRGSRQVTLSMFNLFTFFLDAGIVANGIEPVKSILYTKTLDEAKNILNSYGIYTELDLEEDLAKHGVKPSELTGSLLREIRGKGLEKVRRNKFKANTCSHQRA